MHAVVVHLQVCRSFGAGAAATAPDMQGRQNGGGEEKEPGWVEKVSICIYR